MSENTDFPPEFITEANGPNLNAANRALTVMSAIFLVLRVHRKMTASHCLWWDDPVLVASWVRKPSKLLTRKKEKKFAIPLF